MKHTLTATVRVPAVAKKPGIKIQQNGEDGSENATVTCPGSPTVSSLRTTVVTTLIDAVSQVTRIKVMANPPALEDEKAAKRC